MADYKPVEEMTEQEAQAYCEEYAKTGSWEQKFVETSLKDGDSYRQIAFFLQNN